MKKKQRKKKELWKNRSDKLICVFFLEAKCDKQQPKLNKISVTMLMSTRIFIHTSGSAHSQLLLQIMHIQFIFEKCNFILHFQVSFLLLFLCMTIITAKSERWEKKKKTHKTCRAETQGWAPHVKQWDSCIQIRIFKLLDYYSRANNAWFGCISQIEQNFYREVNLPLPHMVWSHWIST